MIRSKCYFRSTIFDIFSLTHKEEKVWSDGTQPMLFAESSSVCMPKFRPVAPFSFLAKALFLAFLKLLYRKGCGHIDMLMTFPW